MSKGLIGRCIGCFHDFATGPCTSGCGVVADHCHHESSSGIDQNEGPDKVWRCDGCGWLHRIETLDGISYEVDAGGKGVTENGR